MQRDPQPAPESPLAEGIRRCVAHGKQVMLDGQHYADATDERAAIIIADAVEFFGAPLILHIGHPSG